MSNFLSCPKFIMCEGKGDFTPFDKTKNLVGFVLFNSAQTFIIACPNF